MVFNSLVFLVFVVLVFPLYWWISKSKKLNVRNLFIILASYVFYGWWDWRFLTLIVVSSGIDFIAGQKIFSSQNQGNRRASLVVSLIVNLGILAFFKYANFFIESFTDLFGLDPSSKTLNIILPVGISFYTFQTLSYTIDIYRKRFEPTSNVLAFFAFVSFFPQLVAGPIERASALLPQFLKKHAFNYKQGVSGLRLMLWGFFKKIVIADSFGLLANTLFDSTASNAWIPVLGAFLFGIQIYADFSGYSDIAIGLARLFGFELRTNFATPYFSKSFREFWTRWHITLSTWFRDYVYIPLGGSKGTTYRNVMALLITFVVSGLWHGANYTFLIWGAVHGVALLVERGLPKRLKDQVVYGVFAMVLTMLFWLPFRAENSAHLQQLLGLMTNGSWALGEVQTLVQSVYANARLLALGVVFILFMVLEYKLQKRSFDQWVADLPKLGRYGLYYALILCIFLLANLDVKPDFIYFQF